MLIINNKSIPITSNITLTSITEEAYALLVGAVAQQNNPILFVTNCDEEMLQLADHIAFFAPHLRIFPIPAWDSLPYDRVSPSVDLATKRMEMLCRIANLPKGAPPYIVITPVASLLQRIPPRALLRQLSLQINKGENLDRDNFIAILVSYGFLRSATVGAIGEFAVRGSIIDLAIANEPSGVRLDFVGNALESIREFDLDSQITGSFIDAVTIYPASEIILNPETIKLFRSQMLQQFGAKVAADPLYESVSSGRRYVGLEHWLPLFYPYLSSIFDYLPSLQVIYDSKIETTMKSQLDLIAEYFENRRISTKSTVQTSVYNPIEPISMWLSLEELQQNLAQHALIKISKFKSDEKMVDLAFNKMIDFATQSSSKNISAFSLFKSYIAELNLKNNKRRKLLVACATNGSRDRMAHILGASDIYSMIIDDFAGRAQISGKTVGLIILDLDHGFEAEDFAIITEQDLLGQRLSRPAKARQKIEKFLSEIESLNEGELVVHIDHGIGIFEGLETLVVNNIPHDCLRIVYLGGDKLYLPVENIGLISKYGAEGASLDKLGSVAWQTRKAKLHLRIKLAAEVLLKVAAERKLQGAHIIVANPGLYDEFCNRFQYTETEDQLAAIADIIEDLASSAPMDRLVCGDVGFGKTEVALRAAFLAVSSQSDNGEPIQVAVIVPTTLLCRQHYATFLERFAGLPFRVRALSRLINKADSDLTKKQLSEGHVDIIIGTHALFSKDVTFHNLGLVIVDEEQHFGVLQKERLKQLKSNVHVLTLSATPIPRTLQMSLSGIKELSLIATPPVDRLAIRTFVMPFDRVIIREAIMREYFRGGRCFYVAPRISYLTDLEIMLKELVPEIKIVVAHGQLPATRLDQIMNDFYDGKYDLLLSTTIVESGLDVPSANTIIIHRADMLGLSQLYQLRGRVGRGKVRAYAYLTIPVKCNLSVQATQRLEIMQQLEAMGAGFSIASHDMDIRGCGNLVGDEQSGHIREVGIELYQEMLKSAVEQLKAGQKEEEDLIINDKWTPQINIGISVLIPEYYVAELSLRLSLYKRVASLETASCVESFAVEMIDRFGPLPVETEHLLLVVKFKQLCLSANIEKFDCGPKGVVISFKNNQFPNPPKLLDYIFKSPLEAKIRSDQKLVIMCEFKDEAHKLGKVMELLQLLEKLAMI